MGYLRRRFATAVLVAAVVIPLGVAQAQPWTSFGSKTRYLAMGDSLSAGYGAMPVTNGFTYELYQTGVIDQMTNTLFCNMAVTGTVTDDVLKFQVPQVKRFFSKTDDPDYAQVITLTVGGNDMMTILSGADPKSVIQTAGENMSAILSTLHHDFPRARIFVGNVYDPNLGVQGEAQLVMSLNHVIDLAVQYANANSVDSTIQVTLVDLYSAFQGRHSLLLSERPKSDPYQIHPTEAGYHVMAMEFEKAILNTK
jgi:lysophospholipase L1-like esterase